MRKQKKLLLILLPLVVAVAAVAAVLFWWRGAHEGNRHGRRARPQVAAVAGAPRLVVQTGHTDEVTSIAFSPDGETLASGGGEDSPAIKLLNVETGQEVLALEGHSKVVHLVVFSPDGKRLASSDEDDEIKLWSIPEGQLLRTLVGHTSFAISLTFSPDGKTLASSSYDKTIKLWEVESGLLLRTIESPSQDNIASFMSVEFSPDGRTLVSGNEDETIRLWSMPDGQLLRAFEGHTAEVQSVKFSPDGKTLASGSEDKTVKLWAVESGRPLRTLGGHTETITTVAFSPSGKTLASSSSDKTVRLWDVETGLERRNLDPHTEYISSVTFSPDGSMMLTESGDETVNLWSLESGQVVHTFKEKEGISSALFSAGGKTLAIVSRDGPIKLWSVESGQVTSTINGSTLGSSVTFSPDGRTLTIDHASNAINLWSTEDRRVVRTFEGHTDVVQSLAFSPDGKTLASSGMDKTVSLWDINSGQPSHTLEEASEERIEENPNCECGPGNFSYRLMFSPDGKTLAGQRSSDARIVLWNVESGLIAQSYDGGDQDARRQAVAAAPYLFASELARSTYTDDSRFQIKATDGRFRIKTGKSGKPQLFDAKSGKLLATLLSLDEHDWAVVTPDGRFDTSKLDDPQGLHWVMPDASLVPVSFEIFMRHYFEPKMLPRLIRCTKEGDCDREFKPVPSLSALNRAQPEVRITDIRPDSDETLEVTLEVASAKSGAQKDVDGNPVESGVFDVRLFRNGQLVGHAPNNQDGPEREAEGEAAGQGEVELNQDGRATLKFSKIRKPRTGVGSLEFTAYAFNYDQVKSKIDRKAYSIPPETAKGRAYVISLGVNAYELEKLNLRYAANDARHTQEGLIRRLQEQSQYEEVISVPLVSDYTVTGADGRVVAAQDASLA